MVAALYVIKMFAMVSLLVCWEKLVQLKKEYSLMGVLEKFKTVSL